MRQYEVAIRIAQVHHLAEERKYRKALAVIQTLDMRQVRNVSDLKVFAEVYTRTEQLDAAKATYLRIYKKSRTRRILYRLIYLAIRTNNLEEAEKYYKEFIKMNPSGRDALILRYRIDKAAGVPIGQLIDTLKALKEEEYIEEWAYELAKLYQQAGRYEECREECEDIKLWFGTGEIVERAKLLLDHIQEKAPMPFLDDKDFTDLIAKEEPNPDDTGSLPDLSEYLQSSSEQEMKLLKKADPAKFEALKAEKIRTDMPEEGADESVPDAEPAKAEADRRETAILPDDAEPESKVSETPSEAAGSASLVTEKLSEEAGSASLLTETPSEAAGPASLLTETPSEEGGSAGLVTEKSSEEAGSASLLTETPSEEARPASLLTETPSEEAGPAGLVTETPSVEAEPASQVSKMPSEGSIGRASGMAPVSKMPAEKTQADFPRISQSGTGITQDLAKEISAIYEAEHQAQLKEKTVTVIREIPNIANEVVERMTEAVSRTETRTYTPVETEERKQTEDLSGATVVVPDLSAETEGQSEAAAGMETVAPVSTDGAGAASLPAEDSQPDGASFEKLPQENASQESASAMAEKPSELTAELQLLRELEKELHKAETRIEKAVGTADPELAAVSAESKAVMATAKDVIAAVDEKTAGENTGSAGAAGTAGQNVTGTDAAEAAPEGKPAETESESQKQTSATGEVLPDKDLPTTRALHRSFSDILILIGGEMDPSHFVLMGDGKDRILGIAKKIAVVMRETGYLSSGRIAHIGAEQLNQMELAQFKKQLKGNCLLITNAAELLFPTITKVFSMMDEFYGDFTVILSDEGATLDQLFRFVPALARRFKYVIDISQYTEQDYQ